MRAGHHASVGDGHFDMRSRPLARAGDRGDLRPAGLFFDPRSRSEEGQAWGDADAVEQLIQRRAWLVDRAENMEW